MGTFQKIFQDADFIRALKSSIAFNLLDLLLGFPMLWGMEDKNFEYGENGNPVSLAEANPEYTQGCNNSKRKAVSRK
ncbi:MAG: hypothetical protein NC306_03945 [Butyrivibrio sp.]|nr:hypothetical protein [Butyrivibrio sp.]